MREVERLHQGDGRVRVKGQSLTGTLEVQHILRMHSLLRTEYVLIRTSCTVRSSHYKVYTYQCIYIRHVSDGASYIMRVLRSLHCSHGVASGTVPQYRPHQTTLKCEASRVQPRQPASPSQKRPRLQITIAPRHAAIISLCLQTFERNC